MCTLVASCWDFLFCLVYHLCLYVCTCSWGFWSSYTFFLLAEPSPHHCSVRRRWSHQGTHLYIFLFPWAPLVKSVLSSPLLRASSIICFAPKPAPFLLSPAKQVHRLQFFLPISTHLWVRSFLQTFVTCIVTSCPLAFSHSSSRFPFLKYLFSQLFVAGGKFVLAQSLLIWHWSCWQCLLAVASCCLLLCRIYRAATAM